MISIFSLYTCTTSFNFIENYFILVINFEKTVVFPIDMFKNKTILKNLGGIMLIPKLKLF